MYDLGTRKRDGFVVTCLILIFRMPSKIPQEAEIDSDDGEEMMPMGAGYPGMPERKEYLWSCDLKGTTLFLSETRISICLLGRS